MSTICSIPIEVLDLILSYDCINYKVIDLWKCGNRRLNYMLTHGGCSRVELKNTLAFLRTGFPSMLSCLRGLKRLKVTRPKLRFINHNDVFSVLATLSKQLQELILDFEDPDEVLFQALESDHLSNQDMFPNLRTLIVQKDKPFSDLPGDYFDYLPRSLTELTLFIGGGSFFGNTQLLPPNLTSLSVSDAVSVYNLQSLLTNLPMTVTTLNSRTDRFLTLNEFNRLPVQLRRTTILMPSLEQPVQGPQVDSLRFYDLQPEHICYLPRTITKLSLGDLNLTKEAIAALPRSLETIRFESFEGEDLCASDWPPALKTMIIMDSPATTEQNWKSIPSTVTTLRLLWVVDNFVLNCLPSSLTYLDMELLDGDDMTDADPILPAKLQTVIIDGLRHRPISRRILKRLPRFVYTLAFSISESWLEPTSINDPDQLPSFLNKFTLHIRKGDNPVTFECLPLPLPPMLTEFNCDGCYFRSTFTADHASNLPRSLTRLTISFQDLGSGIIAKMPREMKRIYLTSAFYSLDPSELIHLPPRISNLRLSIAWIGDEHLRDLPSTLMEFKINTDSFRLTESGIKGMSSLLRATLPPGANVKFFSFNPSKL